MRFVLIVFFLTTAMLYAQQKIEPSAKFRKYEFILECPMKRCDINGNIIDTNTLVAEIGSKFLLIYAEKDMCIIRFLLNTKRNRKKILNFKGKEIDNYKYYRIHQAQLDFKAINADFNHWKINLGSVITPLKLRLNPFDFSKDFTVGPTFGIKYTPNEFTKVSYNAMIGIGISSVTLDSFNTQGYQKRQVEAVAFTPSIGLMIEVGSSQIGIFTGLDILSGRNDAASKYIYKGSPWISIGFGYGIFSNK